MVVGIVVRVVVVVIGMVVRIVVVVGVVMVIGVVVVNIGIAVVVVTAVVDKSVLSLTKPKVSIVVGTCSRPLMRARTRKNSSGEIVDMIGNMTTFSILNSNCSQISQIDLNEFFPPFLFPQNPARVYDDLPG